MTPHPSFAAFLAGNARWLLAGATLTWASSFGQTFFISLFSAELRAEFGLSHGEWGGLYTAGTVASAALLGLVGGLADRFRARALAVATLGLYALVCIAMSQVASAAMLALVVFGLRFCGQGMMSQIAITAMGRWFRAQRGRAVAIAALGFSLGEATLPTLGVGAVALFGWRGAWVAAALCLLLLAPLMLALLARERTPGQIAETSGHPGFGGRHWTRGEAMRHWLFWALTPGLMGPSFIGTSLFFHQVRVAEVKGWDLLDIAGAYPFYAAATVAVSFLAAWGVDRLGARRLLPLYQLPMALGAAMLSAGGEVWVAWVVFGLMGATQGGAVAILGSLWPEFYGTRHMGAIRGLAVSSMVLSTALGPGVTGALIDLGVTVETQFLWMAAYILGVCALYAALSLRLRAPVGA